MRRYGLFLFLTCIAVAIPNYAQKMPEPEKMGIPVYFHPGTPEPTSLETQMVKPKMGRGMATFELKPERSPVRISETKPRFLIKLTRDPNQPTMDALMSLDQGADKRTGRLVVLRGMGYPMVDKQVEFEFKKFGHSSYVIRPTVPLNPGEYCMSFGNSPIGYFFGIEPGAVDSTEDQAAPVAGTSMAADPNQERLRKLDDLLAKSLIDRTDYDKRKEEILHPAAVKPVTVEDRLRKLDDLLKKGLIGKPEYDKKRAEILSEM